MSVPLPAAFGKYQLISHIAEGGMADVYLGRLTGPGGFEKRLVVKVIRPDLAARREFCEMFVAEAKITVSLTHANIVPVYELGVVEDQYFLAMELVDGPTLHQLVFDPRPRRGGAIPGPLSAYIVEQVLRGLDYAHRQGVVHRDLSPANVMCSRAGEVKIVDFGIAAQVYSRNWSAGLRGGSAGYMAPEQQVQQGGAVDARSDLYAVGVLLAEIATGRRFAEARHGEAWEALPAPLQRIIETAAREQPEDRYPDAAAMLTEVSRYLREVDPPTQSDLSRLVRRRAPDETRLSLGALPRIITRTVHRAEGPRTRPVRPAPTGTEGAGTDGLERLERNDHTPAIRAAHDTGIREWREELRTPSSEVLPALPLPPLVIAPPQGPAPAEPRGPVPTPRSPAPGPPGPSGERPELPVRGGTATFASRPARVHATWRTYAGAILLVIGLGLGAATAWRTLHSGAAPGEEQKDEDRQRAGLLHIELPPFATLSIDGRAAAPGSALMIAPGRHLIEARAPGHRPMVQEVYVRSGETVRERLVLPWSVGHLRLESSPAGAGVLLNGEVQGTTPLDLDVPLDRPASLRLSSKGYLTVVRDIQPSQWVASSPEARLGQGAAGVEAEGRQPEMRLSMTLEPLGKGMLTVGATPWAQVFVDGEHRGDTPVRRIPLSAGSHALRLYCPPPSCQEAREFRQNITVEPAREMRRVVDFRMNPPDVRD